MRRVSMVQCHAGGAVWDGHQNWRHHAVGHPLSGESVTDLCVSAEFERVPCDHKGDASDACCMYTLLWATRCHARTRHSLTSSWANRLAGGIRRSCGSSLRIVVSDRNGQPGDGVGSAHSHPSLEAAPATMVVVVVVVASNAKAFSDNNLMASLVG
jgi:hypothetical protein